MSTSPGFRLRDALRDVIRAPRAASLVIAAALALCLAPLVLYTLSASHRIAQAADGRAAFNAYAVWAVVATLLGAVSSRAAAALVASAMVARRDRPGLPVGVAIARVLAHGVPALLVSLQAAAIAAIGLCVVAAAAMPVAAGEEMLRHASGAPSMIAGVLVSAIALAVWVVTAAAAGWLAALTLPAGPAAAAEQLSPAQAFRRGAELARRAHRRLAQWIVVLFVVALAPLGVARLIVYDATGKKPPVPPIFHVQQIHAAIVIAIAVISTVAQVAIYRRLRDTNS